MTSVVTIERRLRATLYEIGLCTDDQGRLADFYSKALGYGFRDTDAGQLGAANSRRLIICDGPPRTLAYAAYAVVEPSDLMALKARLDRAGVHSTWMNADGFEPGVLAFCDPDGNRFRFGIARATSDVNVDVTAKRPARVQHVVFATTDVQRLLTFFTDVMGFALSDRVVDAEGNLRTAFIRCSPEHHSLAVFAAKENRLDHHCYEANEWNLIRDWADHFSSLRIPLKWGPGRHGPGDNLFLFIHDPDGNWVEISAELEHVEPDRVVGVWPHEERTLNAWGMGLLRS